MLRRLRPSSDEQLVARFRAGDDAAFDAIVERYRPRLVRYAQQMVRRRSSDLPEDIVQDVFVRAYRSLRADDREMVLRPWLYRIAHNRAIDLLRVEPPSELGEDVLRSGPADTSDRAESGERMRELVHDIRQLPPQQRSALVIRELDGLSYDEIATALDTTIPAVKSLLVRARMNLARAAEARAAEGARGAEALPGRGTTAGWTQPAGAAT